MRPHEYQDGYSGMVCTALILDMHGNGADCGKDFNDPIHQTSGSQK